MRYRIRITQVHVADHSVVAKDEEHAMKKIRAELDKPYGLLGRWETASTGPEIVAHDPPEGIAPTIPGEGPLLMSMKDAAAHLGIRAGRVYELVNTGEIDHVRVGRRAYVSRAAVTKFIETNTRSGYQGADPLIRGGVSDRFMGGPVNPPRTCRKALSGRHSVRLFQVLTKRSLDDFRDGRLAIYRFVMHLLVKRLGEADRHDRSLLRILLRPTPGSQRLLLASSPT